MSPEPETNDGSSDPIGADFADDKQAKKQLVLDLIAKRCTSSSEHETLREICRAIHEPGGGRLECDVLSGGITNYSYKVHVPDRPDLRVFAKLSFEYALWNPDAHYDLKRTENECETMRIMHAAAPECVVAPLACWDVVAPGNQKAKLLVTEWSEADEQFGNQFAEGVVDPRIAPQIADTLASLHVRKDFDPHYNEQVKPALKGLLGFVKQSAVDTSKNETAENRTEALMAEMGAEALEMVIQASADDLDTKDCLIHNDAHVFNTLVEQKPSIEALEQFGPNGTVVLCDWEQVVAGPIGKDVGTALAGPIGCLVGHALGNGRREESIDEHIDSLLERYCSKMVEAGKTEEEMAYVMRSIAGWCGWVQFVVLYFLSVQKDAYGVEAEELQEYVRDAMGVLGLKLLSVAYDPSRVPATTTSKGLKAAFKGLVDEEVERALSHFARRKERARPRKSSILRASNRRVSDASFYLAEISADKDLMRRLSASISEGV